MAEVRWSVSTDRWSVRKDTYERVSRLPPRSPRDAEFQDSEDDLETALGLVKELGGLTAARQLASQEGDKALRALECLPQSPAKESLVSMVDWVLERLH